MKYFDRTLLALFLLCVSALYFFSSDLTLILRGSGAQEEAREVSSEVPSRRPSVALSSLGCLVVQGLPLPLMGI